VEQDEDRRPAIEEVLVAPPTEASLRLQLTDLLLRRPSDVRMGRSTREQSYVLQQIESALETYGSYCYPPENPVTVRRPEEKRMPAALRMSGP
jgi:hypothetical protein